MNLTLKIWRQRNASEKGKIVEYKAANISPDMSFLEMMDVVNVDIIKKGEEPVAFDHDCREGICGSCSMYINGEAHGPGRAVTTCQLHMREFNDGEKSKLDSRWETIKWDTKTEFCFHLQSVWKRGPCHSYKTTY